MIEYLYDAIRASSGHDIEIGSMITDANQELITTGCSLVLHNPDFSELYVASGEFQDFNSMWQFKIPADITKGLRGRYWYCIRHNHDDLCFKQPIYLV